MNSCQLQIVENLVIKASEICNVPATAIVSQGKKEKYCIARALVWVVCKNDLSLSFRQIAGYFQRDCKTVWSGYKNMKDEIEVSKERRLTYKQLVNS